MHFQYIFTNNLHVLKDADLKYSGQKSNKNFCHFTWQRLKKAFFPSYKTFSVLKIFSALKNVIGGRSLPYATYKNTWSGPETFPLSSLWGCKSFWCMISIASSSIRWAGKKANWELGKLGNHPVLGASPSSNFSVRKSVSLGTVGMPFRTIHPFHFDHLPW